MHILSPFDTPLSVIEIARRGGEAPPKCLGPLGPVIARRGGEAPPYNRKIIWKSSGRQAVFAVIVSMCGRSSAVGFSA